MILNPPHIVSLLRSYRNMVAASVSGNVFLTLLAGQFHLHLGSISYPEFQRIYHLYLQSIPLEFARAAWGMVAAAYPLPPSPPTQPQP